MCPIIKATDRNRGIHGVAFNFDDMTARANQYLEKVRAEAAQTAARIVAQAKKDAEQIRRQAEADGRRAGQKAIEQTVAAQVGKQMETLLPALRQSVEEIRHARQAWLTHWEKAAVHLSAAIAARVIRRELAAQPEIALTFIREALELVAGSSTVRIHLHPADHEALRPQVDAVVKELGSLAAAELIPDLAVTPGGCRVETQFGTIDQQIETQLARIEDELT